MSSQAKCRQDHRACPELQRVRCLASNVDDAVKLEGRAGAVHSARNPPALPRGDTPRVELRKCAPRPARGMGPMQQQSRLETAGPGLPLVTWMSRSYLATGFAYLAAYVLLDWVSYVHPFAEFGITPWNPQTGLSFALILLLGRSYLPWLMVAPLAADLIVRELPLPLTRGGLVVLITGLGIRPGRAAAARRRASVSIPPCRRAVRCCGCLGLRPSASRRCRSGTASSCCCTALIPAHDSGAGLAARLRRRSDRRDGVHPVPLDRIHAAAHCAARMGGGGHPAADLAALWVVFGFSDALPLSAVLRVFPAGGLDRRAVRPRRRDARACCHPDRRDRNGRAHGPRHGGQMSWPIRR